MRAILEVILIVLSLYWWAVVIVAVLSWLMTMNVVNSQNDLVRSVWFGLRAITEPVLAPIRRFLPEMGGFDISPIILMLAISLIERIIQYNIYPYVVGL